MVSTKWTQWVVKKESKGCAVMAPGLRIPSALAGDRGSVPSTHTQDITTCNSSSSSTDYAHTYTHTLKHIH